MALGSGGARQANLSIYPPQTSLYFFALSLSRSGSPLPLPSAQAASGKQWQP